MKEPFIFQIRPYLSEQTAHFIASYLKGCGGIVIMSKNLDREDLFNDLF